MPAKANPTSETQKTQSMPFVVTTTTVANIPAQKRLGRSSKFQPLLDKLKSLPEDSALSFPISKYTQIQGLRAKLDALGFQITTRSNRDASGNTTLTAYVLHKREEAPAS